MADGLRDRLKKENQDRGNNRGGYRAPSQAQQTSQPIEGSPSVEGNADNGLRHAESTCSIGSGYYMILPSVSTLSTMMRKNNSSVSALFGSIVKKAIADAEKEVEKVKDKALSQASQDLVGSTEAEAREESLSVASPPVKIQLDSINIELDPNSYKLSDLIMGQLSANSAGTVCPKSVASEEGLTSMGALRKPIFFPVEYDQEIHSSTVYGRVASLQNIDNEESRSFIEAAIWKSHMQRDIGGTSAAERIILSKYSLDTASLSSSTLKADGSGVLSKLGGMSLSSSLGDLIYKRKGLFTTEDDTETAIPTELEDGKLYKPGIKGLTDVEDDPDNEDAIWEEDYSVYNSNVTAGTSLIKRTSSLLDTERVDLSPREGLSWSEIFTELNTYANSNKQERKLSPAVRTFLPTIVRVREDLDGSTIINTLDPLDIPEVMENIFIAHYERPPLVEVNVTNKELEGTDIEKYFTPLRSAGVPHTGSEISGIGLGLPFGLGDPTAEDAEEDIISIGPQGITVDSIRLKSPLLEYGTGEGGYIPINAALKDIEPIDIENQSTIFDLAILARIGNIIDKEPDLQMGEIEDLGFSIFGRNGESQEVVTVNPITGRVEEKKLTKYLPFLTEIVATKVIPSQTVNAETGEVENNVLNTEKPIFKPGIVIDRLPFEDPFANSFNSPRNPLPKEGSATSKDIVSHMARESLKVGNSLTDLEKQTLLQTYANRLGDAIDSPGVNSEIQNSLNSLSADANEEEFINLSPAVSQLTFDTIGEGLLLSLFAPFHLEDLFSEPEFRNYFLGTDESVSPTSEILYEMESIELNLPYGDTLKDNPATGDSTIAKLMAIFNTKEVDGNIRIPIGVFIEDETGSNIDTVNPWDLFEELRSIIENTSPSFPEDSAESEEEIPDIVSTPNPSISNLSYVSERFKVVYRTAPSHPRSLFLHVHAVRQILDIYSFVTMLMGEIPLSKLPDVDIEDINMGSSVPGRRAADTTAAVLEELATLAIAEEPNVPGGNRTLTPLYPIALKEPNEDDIVVADSEKEYDLDDLEDNILESGKVEKSIFAGMGYRLFAEDVNTILAPQMKRRESFYGENSPGSTDILSADNYLESHSILTEWNNAVKATNRLNEIDENGNEPKVNKRKKPSSTSEYLAPKPPGELTSVIESVEDSELEGPIYMDIMAEDFSIRPVVVRDIKGTVKGKVTVFSNPQYSSNLLSWRPWNPSVFSKNNTEDNPQLLVAGDETVEDSVTVKPQVENVISPVQDYVGNTAWVGQNNVGSLIQTGETSVRAILETASTLLTSGTGTTSVKVQDFGTLEGSGLVKPIRELTGNPIYITGRTDNRYYPGRNAYPYTFTSRDGLFSEIRFGDSNPGGLDSSEILSTKNFYSRIIHPDDLTSSIGFLWTQSDIALAKRRAVTSGAIFLENILSGLGNEVSFQQAPQGDLTNPLAGVYHYKIDARPPAGYKETSGEKKPSKVGVWVRIPDISEEVDTSKTVFSFVGGGGLFTPPAVPSLTSGKKQLTYYDSYMFPYMVGDKSTRFTTEEIRSNLARTYTREKLDIYTSIMDRLLEIAKDVVTEEAQTSILNMRFPDEEESPDFEDSFSVVISADTKKSKNIMERIIDSLQQSPMSRARGSGLEWLEENSSGNRLWKPESRGKIRVSLGAIYWIGIFFSVLTTQVRLGTKGNKRKMSAITKDALKVLADIRLEYEAKLGSVNGASREGIIATLSSLDFVALNNGISIASGKNCRLTGINAKGTIDSRTRGGYSRMSWATASIYGPGPSLISVPYKENLMGNTRFVMPANIVQGTDFLTFNGDVMQLDFEAAQRGRKNSKGAISGSSERILLNRLGNPSYTFVDLLSGDVDSIDLAYHGMDTLYAARTYLESKYIKKLSQDGYYNRSVSDIEEGLKKVFKVDVDSVLDELRNLIAIANDQETKTVKPTDPGVNLDASSVLIEVDGVLKSLESHASAAYKSYNVLQNETATLMGIVPTNEDTNPVDRIISRETNSQGGKEDEINLETLFWVWSILTAQIYVSIDNPFVEVNIEDTNVSVEEGEFILPDENRDVARLLETDIPLVQDSQDSQDAPDGFTIGNWNLHWFPWSTPVGEHLEEVEALARENNNSSDQAYATLVREAADERLGRLRDELRTRKPNMIFLQEVTGVERTRKVLQDIGYPHVVTIEKGFNRDVNLTPNEDPEARFQRNVTQTFMVGSYFPIVDKWFIDFSLYGNRETYRLPDNNTGLVPPRGILGMRVLVPGRGSFVIYNVHLKSSESLDNETEDLEEAKDNIEKRKEALAHIFSDIRLLDSLHPAPDGLEDEAILICGDFGTPATTSANSEFPYTAGSTVDDSLARVVGKGFTHTAQDLVDGDTYKTVVSVGDRPSIDLDHVFVKSSSDDYTNGITTELIDPSSMTSIPLYEEGFTGLVELGSISDHRLILTKFSNVRG